MTKVAVLVKMAPDVGQLKIDPATQAPRMEGLPWKVSDFDKHAIEAAVKLKEKGQATKVTAYTYNGGANVLNLIKEPLAMGCDEAVVLSGPDTDGIGIAKALAAAVQKDGADLVFAGEVSIDRVAGEPGRILDLTLDELKALAQLADAPRNSTAWVYSRDHVAARQGRVVLDVHPRQAERCLAVAGA